MNRISQHGDANGQLTEELVNKIAERQGMRALPGGQYNNGNNGFDHVFQLPDGSITIVMDSKQISSRGTVKLGKGAGGNVQLSEAWIEAVIDNLPKGAQKYALARIIDDARDRGALRTAVAGVDKRTRLPVMIPVRVR